MSNIAPYGESGNRPLDIAGFNFDKTGQDDNNAGGSTTNKKGGPTNQTSIPFDYRRPEAYERMASDKIGEELAPDATIWKLYLDEAAEYDHELVEGRHKSLDMLLLFAALFSAILTAFLIESKKLLQLDAQDASYGLQLLMAQSQYRMERGLPPVGSDSLPTRPNFVVSASARFINGLWFTSLGLSLSAALVAMLGKEWLTAFLASRPRTAHSHVLMRQARLEGLEDWWALHIIALLPSLLHMSLLLFSIGLVVYLWTLDSAIAAVLASIVAITTLFYLITAVLGAIFDYCPFVTELSKYVRQGVVRIVSRHPSTRSEGSNTSYWNLRALLWLTNNARNSAVVDCSYQVLSGLNVPTQTLSQNKLQTSDALESLKLFSIWNGVNVPEEIDGSVTVVSLLKSMIDCFQQAKTNPLLLLHLHQSALPRLLNAISALAYCVYQPYLETSEEVSRHQGLENEGSWVIANEIPPAELLGLFNDQWDSMNQFQSADNCASLLMAKYGIMIIVFRYVQSQHSPRTDLKSGESVEVPVSNQIASNSHRIDVIKQQPEIDFATLALELRKQYCRWISRVSALLLAHGYGRITIAPHTIECLILCISQSTSPYQKAAKEPTYDDWSKTPSLSQIEYNLRVQIDKSIYYEFSSGDLCRGPPRVLLAVLMKQVRDQSEISLQVCRTAITLYCSSFPLYFSFEPKAEATGHISSVFGGDRWSSSQLVNPRGIRYAIMALALLTIRCLATTGGSSSKHIDFYDLALRLCDATLIQDQLFDNTDGSYVALAKHSDDLIPLINLVKPGSLVLDSFNTSTLTHLVNLSRMVRYEQNETPCYASLTPETFPALLAVIGRLHDWNHDAVKQLLNQMILRIRARDRVRQNPKLAWNDTPSIEFLYPFTRFSDGFSAVASACSNMSYRKILPSYVGELTCLAAGRDPALSFEPIELLFPAVGPFLKVVSIMVKRCRLLKSATENVTSQHLMRRHSAISGLLKALKRFEHQPRVAGIITKLRKLKSELATIDTESINERLDDLIDLYDGNNGSLDDDEDGDEDEDDEDEDDEGEKCSCCDA
ncbi:E3 ubiquitin-protein ligase listerin [Ceratobasidium sp. AG-Ba]|nr:E3 ubiquitin-protein ligase listerin [Ceratobasidium sp. AG-Ba]